MVRRAPAIRRFEAHEWRTYRAVRLRALDESPDAFGSTLELEEGRSDEVWSDRLASGVSSGTDLPLVAEEGASGEPVGLAWGRIEPSEPQTARLYQMWVAPEARGLGAGRMLLDAVIAWARSMNVQRIDLGVTCGDTPATRLYTRAGFESVDDPRPLRPGAPLLAQSMRLKIEARADPDPGRSPDAAR